MSGFIDEWSEIAVVQRERVGKQGLIPFLEG